ncbi:MAG: redoxin domain-containing protein [Candidatus Thorarchaeota archaeon]
MEKKDLHEGDKAPIFKLESFNAGIIDLTDFRGQKVVLIFSRYFGCNICQLDLKTLLMNKNNIEGKEAKIVYITQSGEKVAKEFIEKENINFPVIPSSKEELYNDYGLGLMTAESASKVKEKMKESMKLGISHGEFEGWEKQGPGQFVINEEGNIIHAKKGWLDIDKILSVL